MHCSPHVHVQKNVSLYMPPGFGIYPLLGTIESDHLIPY